MTSTLAVLVTLTGGAGAGKTTVAEAMTTQRGLATLLHLDDYYVTEPGRGSWIADETGTPRLDVGDPRSVDFARLEADTDAALATTAVVIVEGLFAYHAKPSRPHVRFDVFVDLAADLRLARKIHRKCVRDGFPLEILLANYLNHRRDAHTRHIEPVRSRCDLVVDARLPADQLASRIWQAIDDKPARDS